jgi:hypothetical protein
MMALLGQLLLALLLLEGPITGELTAAAPVKACELLQQLHPRPEHDSDSQAFLVHKYPDLHLSL